MTEEQASSPELQGEVESFQSTFNEGVRQSEQYASYVTEFVSGLATKTLEGVAAIQMARKGAQGAQELLSLWPTQETQAQPLSGHDQLTSLLDQRAGLQQETPSAKLIALDNEIAEKAYSLECMKFGFYSEGNDDGMIDVRLAQIQQQLSENIEAAKQGEAILQGLQTEDHPSDADLIQRVPIVILKREEYKHIGQNLKLFGVVDIDDLQPHEDDSVNELFRAQQEAFLAAISREETPKVDEDTDEATEDADNTNSAATTSTNGTEPSANGTKPSEAGGSAGESDPEASGDGGGEALDGEPGGEDEAPAEPETPPAPPKPPEAPPTPPTDDEEPDIPPVAEPKTAENPLDIQLATFNKLYEAQFAAREAVRAVRDAATANIDLRELQKAASSRDPIVLARAMNGIDATGLQALAAALTASEAASKQLIHWQEQGLIIRPEDHQVIEAWRQTESTADVQSQELANKLPDLLTTLTHPSLSLRAKQSALSNLDPVARGAEAKQQTAVDSLRQVHDVLKKYQITSPAPESETATVSTEAPTQEIEITQQMITQQVDALIKQAGINIEYEDRKYLRMLQTNLGIQESTDENQETIYTLSKNSALRAYFEAQAETQFTLDQLNNLVQEAQEDPQGAVSAYFAAHVYLQNQAQQNIALATLHDTAGLVRAQLEEDVSKAIKQVERAARFEHFRVKFADRIADDTTRQKLAQTQSIKAELQQVLSKGADT